LELKTNTDIEWNHSGSFKLLGIQYSLAKNDRYIDNYYSKLEMIKKLLNDWSFRNILYFFQSLTLGYMTPKSEYFFQLHLESEYLFRKKT
jgi:hypothetical protein